MKLVLHFFLPVSLYLLNQHSGNAQLIVMDTLKPSFEWVVPVVDFPYTKDAAQAEANRRVNGDAMTNAGKRFSDYGNFYRNLSMTQNTEMARNLHGSFYYGSNKLWYKVLKPTTSKRYILNRLFANLTSTATDFLLTKVPYGFAYQHEEFHRSVMSVRGIYSYDDVWKFGRGLDIAVTKVKDEDLIYLKKNHPADLVRLGAAGVEAEYFYIQRIREDNFFRNAAHPAVGIMIIGTVHSISYVNLPFASRFNAITDSILSYDKNDILARDFTGYDFSAWVYDLHRPDETYENRGQWPGGIGIKRPIKESDLTDEMRGFLKETGNMQYLNFISPFMLGINQFRLSENVKFNFNFRSVPTSFGYFAGSDFYLQLKERKLFFSLGVNRSKNLVLPHLECKLFSLQSKRNEKLTADVKAALWLQPKKQMFYSNSSTAGGMIFIQPDYRISDRLSVYSDIEYKTGGWVFGNPYLDNNFTFRLGAKIRTN